MSVHQDAVAWLDERDGNHVTVSVHVDGGEYRAAVLQAEGVLEHWRGDDTETGHAWAGIAREDISEVYVVGGSLVLDVTDVAEATIGVGPEQNDLVLVLDEDVRLTIVERLS